LWQKDIHFFYRCTKPIEARRRTFMYEGDTFEVSENS